MTEDQHQQPNVAASNLIRVLGGIAMLSGFLVALVFQVTKPVIAENKRLAIEKAVLQVVPDAASYRQFSLGEQGISSDENQQDGIPVYAAYDENGELTGIALEGSAFGYAGKIYLLYGYDPTCECIRGIKVLKMIETPGLGDKIITDQAFVANFNALDAKLTSDHMQLANPIVTVKAGTKRSNWEIDAISGATISSKAVGRALNESAQTLLPKLVPEIDKLRQLQSAELKEAQP
ncbi:MAG TPA: FMN-binding protein [Gammaproteobacteria bacterium]|nr:FMN-binding protein [Gammaproteobacteria bacterium]